MAVVSEVPTEVLSEIFYLLCKRPIYLNKLKNSYYMAFPWAVGLVCRQWRTAFLTYPPIWASLSFDDIANSSESYATEINRRLALYLERSGEYPLTLDIDLWSNHNKAFTMIILEMLSACAHRWQTMKLSLSLEWHLNCILPCKGQFPTLEWPDNKASIVPKHTRNVFEVAPRLTHVYAGQWVENRAWILPYPQLTELQLTLDRDARDGKVLKLLQMLHNIKKFCLHCGFDSQGGLPQLASTPLNRLRVLEVDHPTTLSWFETPSLCELYFNVYWKDTDEPLDIHGQTSSLIQRSGCQIRKVSFMSSRQIHTGMLKDVEELEIKCIDTRICPSIDTSSLPKLRFLTVICWMHVDKESLENWIIAALKSAKVPLRDECSTCTPISCLERVTIELLPSYEHQEVPKGLLEIADKWPLVVFRT